MSNKKSYICEKVGKTLNFLPTKINFCCSYAEGPSAKLNSNELFNINKIIKQEKDVIKKLKFGEIPKECKGCIDYKEKEYKNIFEFLFSRPKSFLVNEIIVNHFKQCDCNCVYCAQKIIWGSNTSQYYDLLPIIKQLYKNNAVDTENLKVEFQGGNVSLLEEFEPLVREFILNGCSRLSILTNGIKYLPVIEEAVGKCIIDLQISLDCGSKETFKNIKQVDAFEQVINNIKEFSIRTNALINLKYILLKDLNDNEWEVNKFLEVVKDLRCIKSVCFDIDYRDILLEPEKNFKVPKHYFDLINKAKAFCEENRINFTVVPMAEQYMKDHMEE